MRLFKRNAGPLVSNSKRKARKLDVYVIDRGSNPEGTALLDRYASSLEELSADHRLFILSKEQSAEVIEQNAQLAGSDPVIVLLNSDARIEQRQNYGVQIRLGGIPEEQAEGILCGVLKQVSDADKNSDAIIAETIAQFGAQPMISAN